jgi:hypothetical protein
VGVVVGVVVGVGVRERVGVSVAVDVDVKDPIVALASAVSVLSYRTRVSASENRSTSHSLTELQALQTMASRMAIATTITKVIILFLPMAESPGALNNQCVRRIASPCLKDTRVFGNIDSTMNNQFLFQKAGKLSQPATYQDRFGIRR